MFGAGGAHLHEADVVGVLPEALAAQVDVVLAHHGVLVRADAALARALAVLAGVGVLDVGHTGDRGEGGEGGGARGRWNKKGSAAGRCDLPQKPSWRRTYPELAKTG